ncbi:phage virion morphogenesis protein [Pseudomonas sp. 43mfcvi1.1]|uniref:phage virion morphogenesis protein n=1 Tax=Pseudomonas sp. 43mfcvi1.1 TaxID=1761894 RepID=UPI000D6BA939|nr:phage virion morphogenesis protein [Pseudomonas sp. 43mfcvi1.1]
MTNRLEALEDWAGGLLGQLEPTARNKLARNIGQTLRRSQQQRIIAQRNPDGSKYAPRKQRNLRRKQGRVKRKVQMFQKMRTATFLKAKVNGPAISVGFTGRLARIARVHQYGLRDRAERNASMVRYQQREILGLTEVEIELIRDALLANVPT